MIPVLPALENQHLTGNKVGAWNGSLANVSLSCAFSSTHPGTSHVIGVHVVRSRRACKANMQMLAL